MVSSNTETGITVTYEDGDNTLDFVVGTLNQNTTGTAANLSGTPDITVGTVTATSLDISGNVDVDGTLEADAITVNGATLAAATATDISWTAGTTAGPTCNSSTGSDSAIPSATGSASGVVTTGTQTFAGAKTFSGNVSIGGNLEVTGTSTVTNILGR